MGYYLQAAPDQNFGKAEFLCQKYNGRVITVEEAKLLIGDPDKVALVCVVNNGIFEAAAYCYSAAEFEVFSSTGDIRPRTWLRFDNVSEIRQASGY
jgi:hypothetical protein